jgi:hypothetical protein
MRELQRGKGEELANILLDDDSEITEAQIEAWADHDLEEWLGIQGYEWDDDEEEWLLSAW